MFWNTVVCAVDADKDSDQLSARKDDNQRNLAFLLEKVEGCAVSTFLSDTAYIISSAHCKYFNSAILVETK